MLEKKSRNEGACKKILKQIKTYYIDVDQLPHSSLSLQITQDLIIKFSLLYMLLVNTHHKSHQEMVFQQLENIYSLGGIEKSGKVAILLIFFSLLICVITMLFFMWRMNRDIKKNLFSLRRLGNLCTLILYLKCSFLLPFKMTTTVGLVKDYSSFYFIPAAIAMFSTPLELFLHQILTHDYKFQRTNILQGRNYSFFNYQITIYWLVAIASLSVMNTGLQNLKDTVMYCHVLFGAGLWIFLMVTDNYFQHPTFAAASVITTSFYLMMGLLEVIVKMGGMDYGSLFYWVWVVLSTLLTFTNNRVRHRLRLRYLFKIINSIKSSDSQMEAFFDQIYKLYCEKDSNLESKLILSGFMADHSTTCSNPLCMCFEMLKLLRTEAALSIMRRHDGEDSHLNPNPNLSTFSNIGFVQHVRQSHGRTAASSIRKEDGVVEVNWSSKVNDASFIDLAHSTGFHHYLISFASSFIKSRQNTDLFNLAIKTAAFMIYEYSNPTAGILFLTEYKHSNSYKRIKSPIRNLLLENYIYLTREQLSELELGKNHSEGEFVLFANLKMGEIADFKNRIDLLRSEVNKLISLKASIYGAMQEHQINFVQLTSRSTETFKDMQQFQREISSLMKKSTFNTDLLRCAYEFEKKVQEKQTISSGLKRVIREVLFSNKMRFSSFTKKAHEMMFNYYDAGHSIVMTHNWAATYKIYYTTENCLDLLGFVNCAKSELIGLKITDFMPSCISKSHDRFMVDYINGQSKAHFGKVDACILTKDGVPKPVMILPRIDCLFSDELLIGALISHRKDHQHPFLLTDEAGGLVACNHQFKAQLLKDEEMNSDALFCVFPGLYRYYYPDKYAQLKRTGPSNTGGVGFEGEQADFESYFDGAKPIIRIFSLPMLRRGFDRGLQTSKTTTIEEDRRLPFASTTGIRLWKKVKKTIHALNSKKKSVRSMADFFFKQRNTIKTEMHALKEVSLSVDRLEYTGGLKLIEIEVDSIRPAHSKYQQMFDIYIAHVGYNLFELMMSEPETIDGMFAMTWNIFKIASMASQTHPPIDIIKKLLVSFASQTIEVLQTVQSKQPVVPVDMRRILSDKVARVTATQEVLESNDNIHKQLLGVSAIGMKESHIINRYANGIQMEMIKSRQKIVDSQGSRPRLQSREKYHAARSTFILKSLTKIIFGIEDLNQSFCEDNPDPHKLPGVPLDSKVANKSNPKIDEPHSSDDILQISSDLSNALSSLISHFRPSQLIALSAATIQWHEVHIAAKNNKMIISKPANIFIEVSNVGDAVGERDISGDHMVASSEDNESENCIFSEGFDTRENMTLHDIGNIGKSLGASTTNPSSRSSFEANAVRMKILQRYSNFRYVRWEVLMYLMVVLVMVAKLWLKLEYNARVAADIKSQVFTSEVSFILRPLGFSTKETLKCLGIFAAGLDDPELLDTEYFMEEQFSFLNNRLKENIQYMHKFYTDGLKTSFSFIDDHPTANLSVFSMCYSMTYLIGELNRLIHDGKKNDLTSLCNKVNQVSLHLFETIIDRYIIEIDKGEKNHRAFQTFFILVVIMNFLTSIPLALILIQILSSVANQIKTEAQLLARLDKVMLQSLASGIFKTESASVDEMAGIMAFNSFHQQQRLEADGHDKLATANLVKMPVHSLKKIKPKIGSSKRFKVAKANGVKVFNLPQRNSLLRVALVICLTSLAAIPSVLDMVFQISFLSVSQSSVRSIASTNLISSSIFRLKSYEYKVIYHSSSPLDPLTEELDKQMLEFYNKFQSLESVELEKQIKTILMCDRIESILGKADKEKCLSVMVDRQDRNIYHILNDFKLFFDEFRFRASSKRLIEKPAAFFNSETFKKNDLISYYLTLATRDVCVKFLDAAQKRDIATLQNSRYYTVLEVIGLLLMVVFYKFVWIANRLVPLKSLRHTFMLMNDDILTSMYIKSYFTKNNK